MSYLIIKQDAPFLLKNKNEVLKVYLYIKMLQKGISPFENDLDVLSELFFFGGYEGDKEKKEFYKLLISKKLRGSDQSTSNKLTEFYEKGLILRPEKNTVKLNYEFFPESIEDIKGIGLILKVCHAS